MDRKIPPKLDLHSPPHRQQRLASSPAGGTSSHFKRLHSFDGYAGKMDKRGSEN